MTAWLWTMTFVALMAGLSIGKSAAECNQGCKAVGMEWNYDSYGDSCACQPVRPPCQVARVVGCKP